MSNISSAKLAPAVMEGGDLVYLVSNNYTNLQQQFNIKTDCSPMLKLELCTERKTVFRQKRITSTLSSYLVKKIFL